MNVFKTKKGIINTSIIAVFAVLFIVLSIVMYDKTVEEGSVYYGTFISLMPPIIAILLALITKEVFSSLFIGIVAGALLVSNFSPSGTIDGIVSEGIISAVSGTAGIFVFLVILGVLVALINKAGGSYAFGRWAKANIKTRAGATFATFLLGVIIFIDDYFNCLTVGSVMRPVTDSHKISREKLAFLIDATAAPVCMIAPISSWAAAVSEYAEDGQGLSLFISAIPFNYYSLLTLVFIVLITFIGFDYGKMAEFEIKARMADNVYENDDNAEKPDDGINRNGRVIDLVLPIVLLIVFSVIGLIYCGNFFDSSAAEYHDFVSAFANTDASVGLAWGSIIALVIIIIYLIARRVIDFKGAMDCIPNGFIAMVPAILILTFATSLKNMTSLLGADAFVDHAMRGAADGLKNILPAIIFLVACFLAFATGTSWGTFGILIPIVAAVFDSNTVIYTIGISACLAGAVCGDHCSPISDTTIMSSAGAQCNHVNHVTTQLPYAFTVAAVSFVSFIIAGFVQNAWIVLPIAIVLLVLTVFGIKYVTGKIKSK